MISMKMVMLSETLTVVKMKSKSMVLGCGMNPETKEVKWVDPAAVTALAHDVIKLFTAVIYES
jgi:hypothetical protein